LDVSVEETSICIVDDTGRIVREVKVASEPEALLAVLKNPAYLRLSEMPREVLRVECLRCLRVVEIRKMDAIRLCGPHAIWKGNVCSITTASNAQGVMNKMAVGRTS
jgi:hypothetical protein